MNIEERFNELETIKPNVQKIEFVKNIGKCTIWGSKLAEFITNFDFSLLDSCCISKFVDVIGEGYKFKLEAIFIKSILEETISDPVCTKEFMKTLIDICNYNAFGIRERFNTENPLIIDSIKAFVNMFKQSQDHYTNIVINCNNKYKLSPTIQNIYPSDGIEIRLYNKSYYNLD